MLAISKSTNNHSNWVSHAAAFASGAHSIIDKFGFYLNPREVREGCCLTFVFVYFSLEHPVS